MVKREHERHLERLQALVEGADSRYKPIPAEELRFLTELENALRELNDPGPPRRSPEDWKRAVSRALENCGYPKEQIDEEIDDFIADMDKATAGGGGG